MRHVIAAGAGLLLLSSAAAGDTGLQLTAIPDSAAFDESAVNCSARLFDDAPESRWFLFSGLRFAPEQDVVEISDTPAHTMLDCAQLFDRRSDSELMSVSTSCADECCESECCRTKCWYSSLTLDGSGLFGNTFGVNLANEVPAGIQGGGSDSSFAIGGAVGRYFCICILDRPVQLRAEFQAVHRHKFDFLTGPAGTPASQYLANIEDVWTATANLWVDLPITEKLGGFAGFGLGGAGYDISVANLVPPASFLAVRGSGSSSQFTYMFGAGVYYRLLERVTLDVGWRYVDLGDASVGLVAVNGGFPAGTYTVDLDAHELLINLRFDL